MGVATRVWVAAALLGAAGCGDGSVGPQEVAGRYQATTFSVQINGATTELLSRGASVDLELRADGTTAGRIIIPAVPGVQLTAVDHDLAGTYAVSSDVVRLNQTADTYLDGVFFTADPPELRSFITITDATRTGSVTLILTRR